MSTEQPAHHDLDRLCAAYEEADGDLQEVAAQFPGASRQAVRKKLVRSGIHQPDKNRWYKTLLEEMTVEEFDQILAEQRGEH